MKYFNNSTGGTTGTPLNYRLTNFDRFLGAALLYQGWGYAGYELADKMVFLGAAALNINIETGLDKRLNEYLRNIRKLSSFDMVIVELKYRRIINTFKPKFIRGYASSLSFFANWLSENNITIHSPVATFTTSDQLFPNMREKIKSTFSCPVYDGYGLNDGGVKAFECEEHNGYHIDMERSIMEIVPRARRIKKK
jgi:phenylacetate-CoA ligase